MKKIILMSFILIMSFNVYTKSEKLNKIKKDISLLNLLKGLYLSEEQIDKLINISSKVDSIRNKALNEVKEDDENTTKIYEKLKNELFRSSAGQTNKNIQKEAENKKHKLKELKIKYSKILGKYEDEAVKIFSNAQIKIIKDFKPCLIPPKDLSDPVRVGQANATSSFLDNVVDIIHRMPNDFYLKNRKDIINRLLEYYEKEKGKISLEIRKKVIDGIGSILDSVSTTDDIDFALKKEELSKSLELFDDTKVYKKGVRISGQVSKFFLAENSAEILKKWKYSLKNYKGSNIIQTKETNKKDFSKDSLTEKTVLKMRSIANRLVKERKELGFNTKELVNQKEQLKKALDSKDYDIAKSILEESIEILNDFKITKLSLRSLQSIILAIAKEKRIPIKTKKIDILGIKHIFLKIKEDIRSNKLDEAYRQLYYIYGVLKRFKS